MKVELKFILAIACIMSGASCAVDFPSNIQRCKYDDEACIIKEWNKMLELSYISGVPELDIPISDAFHIDREVINIGSNLMTIKIVFKNATALGLGHTVVNGVKGFKKDVREMERLVVTGFIPVISIIGTYEGSGKLLLLQGSGTGRGEIHMYNTTYEITIATKVNTVDGEDYLVPAKVTTTFETEKFRYMFENILNRKDISDTINKVLNDNDKLFALDAKVPIARSFSKVFKQAVAPTFKKFPYRSFFLE